MLPYGKMMANSAYFMLLNYDKKVLINTGTIENQDEILSILEKAGLTVNDIDYVFNMTSRPEHIGLNAVFQFQNNKARFFTHPDETAYIEDTILQHEERYVPGFYKLVSGNTDNIRALENGQKIDIGDESIRVIYHTQDERHDGKFSLYLENSKILISSDEIKPVNHFERRMPVKRKFYQLAGSL
jgi:glyoxylase-like metal-dependent hydrolase (beta-lactamase superfamily II)